ncbi:MAG: glycine cleavage T C-terminal barrel domain-containing protein [Hyphomicrobiaceae bacterium]
MRIQAALLFFGYDMTDEHYPWEVGPGFTINRKKAAFRGHDAALAAEGKERFVAVGIVFDHDDAVAGGETLQWNGEDVGVINSPGYSHRLGKSPALVHLRRDAAVLGTQLQAVGEGTTYVASVAQVPFYDPTKSRVRGRQKRMHLA